MIDWPQVFLNLRLALGSDVIVAKRLGCHVTTLQNYTSGRVIEPKFDLGKRALDLHFDHCRNSNQSHGNGAGQS